MSFSRRTLLKASAASAVLGGIGAPLVARAQTAEFTYKYANNLPDGHPMNARAKEMAAAIKARPMAGSTCRFSRTTSSVPIPTC
jgi:TRAP-type C4-dicarboxylate transport system substrate-binding protein